MGRPNPKHKKINNNRKLEKNFLSNKSEYNRGKRAVPIDVILTKEKVNTIIIDGGEDNDTFIIKNDKFNSLNLCPLCKKNERSEDSHIIPRFIGADIVKRSKSGYMRNRDNKRVSLPTYPLLCKDCEQLFSKFEKYFAENFYYVVRNEELREISQSDELKLEECIKNKEIDEWFKVMTKYGVGDISYNDFLIKFIVSISWRILIMEIIHAKYNNENTPKYMTEVEDNWRTYLLGNSQSPSKKHYLILTTVVANDNMSDESISFYNKIRTTWTHISQQSTMFGFSSDKDEFIYCNMPNFLIISTLKSNEILGYDTAEINLNGVYPIYQKIDRSHFDMIDFLMKIYFKDYEPLQDSEIEKIKKSVEKKQRKLKPAVSDFKIMQENVGLLKSEKESIKINFDRSKSIEYLHYVNIYCIVEFQTRDKIIKIEFTCNVEPIPIVKEQFQNSGDLMLEYGIKYLNEKYGINPIHMKEI